MKLDIMAIGAHPDDVELSCGGTIAKLVRQGRRVGLVDLTNGELGTRGTPEIRAAEAAEAGRILGISARESLGIPDGNVEMTQENILRLVQVIRAYRPEVLLIPHSIDRHPDHEHAHSLCKKAWFAAGLRRINTTYKGEEQLPHRPRAYYHFMQWFEFPPSFIVDVTETYELRMLAMRAFRSQFFDPDSTEPQTVLSTPEFLEMLNTRLSYYGDKIDRKYGEAFLSPTAIQVNDLFSLNT
jgi:N-acetylglucosamine malate deacetylase 1